MSSSVGEDFPIQQARVRRCLENGLEIGPAGMFYVAVCRKALADADRAAISGDLVEILRAYQELKDISE
jgi:hypothetical protein